MKTTVIALLLLIPSIHSYGAEVMTRGIGADASCGRWLYYRQRDADSNMANWALGFISGAATLGGVGDPLRDVDYQGVEYWLDNYCRAHPDDLFVYAVEAFIGTH
jgi:hypothetical protein